MTESYQYWQDALEGRFGAIVETEPQSGFWRKKSAGVWLPVAIWDESDVVWAQVGRESPTGKSDLVRDTWLACAKYPVTEKEYRHAVATGSWLGEAPAEVRGIGDNQPPEGAEEIAAAIDEAAKEAEAWLEGRAIESQADADKCETWANALLILKKQAEEAHRKDKAPHLEAGRKVDARYKPLIETAQAWARALKAAATRYLVARETERREAAAKLIAKGEDVARMETRATTSGVSGRKLSLRTVRKAEIEDWDAAIAFFKDNPELRALVQKLADKCAAVEAKVPGVKIVTEQKAA